jgi:hypothetical protein
MPPTRPRLAPTLRPRRTTTTSICYRFRPRSLIQGGRRQLIDGRHTCSASHPPRPSVRTGLARIAISWAPPSSADERRAATDDRTHTYVRNFGPFAIFLNFLSVFLNHRYPAFFDNQRPQSAVQSEADTVSETAPTPKQRMGAQRLVLREGWACDGITREEGVTSERIRQIVSDLLQTLSVYLGADHARGGGEILIWIGRNPLRSCDSNE